MRLLLVTISILLSVFCAEAQTEKPIRWVFSLSKNEVKQGEVVEIIMKAEINPDWYLYSSDFETGGPTVTSITFENNGSFKSIGELKPFGTKEKYDSLFELKVRYFVKHAEFRQKVKILKVNPLIKGTLMYQVCSDREGKCIPYEESLVFNNLKVAAGELVPEKQETSVGQTNTTNTSKEPEVKKPVYKDKLSELEAEKNKLVEKDSNGNDIAIEQLKTFTQKYGGDK